MGMSGQMNIGQAVQNIAQGQAVAAPAVSLDRVADVFLQGQAAAYDRSRDGYPNMANISMPLTPADWLGKHVEILEALRDVMETLKAQETVTLEGYKDKPLQRQIYQNIMHAGIAAATGKK